MTRRRQRQCERLEGNSAGAAEAGADTNWGAVETRYISRYMITKQNGPTYHHGLTELGLEGIDVGGHGGRVRENCWIHKARNNLNT
jgi:hypothetical protein